MSLFKKTSKESWHSVIKSFRTFDEQTFEQVFRDNYASLVVMAMRWIKDKDSAKNIVQDVFFKLWEKRSSVQIDSWQSYLRVAVRNSCFNELKHVEVIRGYERRFSEEEEAMPDYDVSSDLFAQRLYEAIDDMPPQRRKIFLLSRVDGKKYREIAQLLSLSPKTVEAQMGKALQFLRTKLAAVRTQMQSFLL